MCLMPLNCTLKTVKIVNFTLCIFYYSKKIKDQDYILTQNKIFVTLWTVSHTIPNHRHPPLHKNETIQTEVNGKHVS